MHNSLVNEFMYIYIYVYVCIYLFIAYNIYHIIFYVNLLIPSISSIFFSHSIYFIFSFLLYIFLIRLVIIPTIFILTYFFDFENHYLFHLTIIGICMLNSLHLFFPNELYVFSLSGIAVVYAILNNILIR